MTARTRVSECVLVFPCPDDRTRGHVVIDGGKTGIPQGTKVALTGRSVGWFGKKHKLYHKTQVTPLA